MSRSRLNLLSILVLVDAGSTLRTLCIDSCCIFELHFYRAVNILLEDRLGLILLELGLRDPST
jgi:hypothetical protein